MSKRTFHIIALVDITMGYHFEIIAADWKGKVDSVAIYIYFDGYRTLVHLKFSPKQYNLPRFLTLMKFILQLTPLTVWKIYFSGYIYFHSYST